MREMGGSQGISQGAAEARRDMLRTLMTERLGPLPAAVEARLAKATPDMLATWTQRLLSAPTSDDVVA